MRENAGKMQTRIIPNMDTFYAVYISLLQLEAYIKNVSGLVNWAHNNLSYIIDTSIMRLGWNKWDKI